MATELYAKLEASLQQKSDGYILPVAEQLLPIDAELIASVRQRLLLWFPVELRRLLLALDAGIKAHEKNLARADLGEVARRYLKKHLGQQPPLNPAVGHGLDYKDALPLARLLRLVLTKRRLILSLVGLALGAVLVGVLDYKMVSHLIREGSVGVLGVSTSPRFELIAVSLATIVAYTLMGVVWGKHPVRRVTVVAVYGIVFGYLAHFTAANLDDVHGLWAVLSQWGWVVLKTAIYTFPGLLLFALDHWLWFWLRLSHKWAIAGRMIAEDDQLQVERGDKAEGEALAEQKESMIDVALSASMEAAAASYAHARDRANIQLDDVATSEAEKEQAEEVRVRAGNHLDTAHRLRRVALLAVLLSGLALGVAGCDSESAPITERELVAKTSNLVMAVDQSRSSPALDAAWMQSTFPYIVDQEVNELPIAAMVSVIGMGDQSQAQEESTTRVQLRKSNLGLPQKEVAGWVHERLLALTKPQQPFAKSELVSGVCEAAKLLRAHAPQSTLLWFSDGIEESGYAICRPVSPGGKGKKSSNGMCKLPSPPCQFPKNARVIMVGIGIGLDGARGAALQAEWRQFFVRAGVAPEHIALKH